MNIGTRIKALLFLNASYHKLVGGAKRELRGSDITGGFAILYACEFLMLDVLNTYIVNLDFLYYKFLIVVPIVFHGSLDFFYKNEIAFLVNNYPASYGSKSFYWFCLIVAVGFVSALFWLFH